MRAAKVLKAGETDRKLPPPEEMLACLMAQMAAPPQEEDRKEWIGTAILRLVALCRVWGVAPEIALDQRMETYISDFAGGKYRLFDEKM